MSEVKLPLRSRSSDSCSLYTSYEATKPNSNEEVRGRGRMSGDQQPEGFTFAAFNDARLFERRARAWGGCDLTQQRSRDVRGVSRPCIRRATEQRADNPADKLVAVINTNRTAGKFTELFDNPGLGCIALQYIKGYEGQCSEVGDMKKPPDSDFADKFAPNCGVLAQTITPITGRFLACQSKYVSPEEAFSSFIIQNSESLKILHDKNHTEVGAAVSGTDGGSPYFWCVLFSNGKRNSSFAFENGQAKSVHPGCFSGNSDDCSASTRLAISGSRIWPILLVVFFGVLYVL